MKNFTKQNFKTNPLWIRLLIMVFMLLIGSSTAWGANKALYLDAGGSTLWDQASAKFVAYVWADGVNATWYEATKVGSYYQVIVSDNVTKVIWLRKNPSGYVYNDWNCWNRVGDVTGMDTNNLTTVTGWSESSFKTSYYDDITTYTVSGTDATVKLSDSDKWVTYTLYKDGSAVANSGKAGTGSALSWTVTTSGTYTIKGTNTYKTEDMSGSYTYTSCETPSAAQYSMSPTTFTYNGSKQVPTITPASGAGAVTSTAYKQGSTTVASPTNAGTYTVYVTSSDGTTYCGASNLEIGTFTINKATVAAAQYSMSPTTFTYNGSKQVPTITPVSGAGAVTSTVYKQGSTTVASPTNAGTYDVYVTSSAGTNYTAASNLKIGSFTINKATVAAVQYSMSPTTFTYNGSKQVPTITPASGAGAVTSTVYKQGSTTVASPTNAGTYTVYVTSSAGTNYTAASSLNIGTFTINGKAPVDTDFTYTAEKNYTGAVVSADVAWKTDLAAGTGGAITTYYKVKGANDNTYTTTQPSAVGTYTVAVTTAAGGNYAAATEKIALGDFTINEVCNPISGLTWRVTSGEKETYCSGDKVQVTMTYNGNTATAYSRGGNHEGNIDFNVSSMASGVVYTFTIRKSGTINLTLTGCDGKTATTETLTFNVMADPATPTVEVVNNIIKCGNDYTQYGKIRITNYNSDYSYKIGANNDPLDPSAIDVNGNISGLTIADQFTLYAINGCGVEVPSAAFTITETNNKPTVTGTNSFQPGGSTTLTSDKGASTTWLALDGGDLNTRTGEKVVFTAKDKGTYNVQATYNGCSTTYTIKVQDDLYVWVRRPIKKEKAYDEFYHEDQNSEKGGDLFYKEFASLPGDYQQYNQGGKVADATCTDKDGYKWYGFIVSKTAIENNYYFTVHAPNDGGKKGDSQKYGGYYTHTYATQLVDMESDLYFVMDESASGSSRGWNINAPVVVRASGDASFNGNNFADFVPLYVKDANTCNKEVVSFEWQKSDSQNGTYTTYKSGKGINNIRTREAGWYRCVVTYHDASAGTSNAIQVTTGATDVANYDSKYDVSGSNLPIIMVNTNGVGFPSDKNLSVYPSAKADDLKAKVSVDVIIKKGDEILYDKKARMNYRGSSSLNFKKKSYAFVSGQDSCVFDKSRHDYVKTKKAKMFEVLGQSGYSANDKDWVLYAATPDPSMMRNRLVFDLYQQMRPKEWGVHTTYVELIVDGEYQGVYVFMDKITANEKRINITNANGFIVKFDKTDCADRIGGYNGKVGDEKTFKTERTGNKGIGTYDTTVDQLFEIEYPEKEDIEDEGGVWEEVYQPIIDRFEEFEEALSLGNYTRVRDIIDYDSWADWFVLTEFIKNQDGFRASCIFTFSGEQGDKIKATPLWDQELSMNNRARTSHGSSTTSGLLVTTSSIYSDDFPAPFWFTGEKDPKNEINCGLLKDECFVSLVKEKWAQYSAAEGILSKDNIEPMIEAYAAELEEGAQTREATKWPYTGEVRGMTNNGKTVGYFGKNEGTAVDYEDSKADIISWAGTRVSPLTTEINKLEGEAIIFTLNPENPETTPWAPVLLTVNVPDDYKYNMDFTALPADAVIKEGNNNYSIKLPQPADWVSGGDGGVKSATYVVKAKLEIGDETTVCGTTVKAEKQSTITLKETYEDCSED